MRFGIVIAALCLVVGALWAAPPSREEPPYYDPDRSLKQQQEAEQEARAKAQTASAAEVAAYFTDDSAMVRDSVFKVVVKRDDAALLQQISGQIGSRDPFVSATTAELLGACGYAEGRRALEKGLGSRDEQTALECIWALEALGDPASADALAKAHKRRKEFRVQGDALIALAAIDPEAASELAEESLESKAPPLRIAGLVALRHVDMQRAIRAAVAVIGAEPYKKKVRLWEPRVLFAALENLAIWVERSNDRELAVEAVDALIARLGREEGLPQHKLGLALADLTQQQGLEADAEIWQGWWTPQRDSFEFQDRQPQEPSAPERGLPAGDDAEGDAPARPKTGDGPQTRVRFHGIPIYSNRLVFAQDISGGMNNPLDKDEPDSPPKMKFSKDELERVLKSLDDEIGTNIVFFATEYYRPAEQLVPLGRNRETLLQFVREQETPDWHQPGQKHASRSNLYDTLAFAMQDPQIDTIFFLSEGGPNEGRFVDHDRFMSHLARLNVYQRVEVHTLQVTSSKSLTRFLRRLAETTGGQFYDLEFLKQAHR